METKQLESISKFIINTIINIPESKISAVFDSLENMNKKEIVSFILQHYGGSLSHDFLLKIHKVVLDFKCSDWNALFNLIDYNESLGKEALYTFFIFHTSLRDIDYFEAIGIKQEIRDRFNPIFLKGTYEELPRAFKSRNNQNYERLGMSKDEIKYVNEFKFIDIKG